MNDTLNLCADVGIAIKNMHQNDTIFIKNFDDNLSDRKYNSRRY